MAVLAAGLFSAGDAHAQARIASPAIEESLFKEGAIQARQFNAGQWYAKCQEIVKLNKRICNLLAALPGRDGALEGSILIATTDTGVPAVLIAIPKDVSQGRPISVKASNVGKVDGKPIKVDYSTVVENTQCEATCKYMFPLDPKLVFALNAGESAEVQVPADPAPSPPPQPSNKIMKTLQSLLRLGEDESTKSDTSRYTIPGNGFAEALKASVQGW